MYSNTTGTAKNQSAPTRAAFIHETAEIESGAAVGPGTKVWHYAHIRTGAVIGRNCVIGRGVYIDENVVVGDNCKIQNGANLYCGAVLGNGVFVGPGAIVTNDPHPRAANPDGSLKSRDDWECGQVVVGDGSSLGAGVIVLPNVIVAPGSMIGAGAVVSKSTNGTTWSGVPAREHTRFVDHERTEQH